MSVIGRSVDSVAVDKWSPFSHNGYMPKRSSNKSIESKPALDAAEQPSAAPEPSPPAMNPHAVALGKLGGAKGGAARAKKLTAEQRSEIGKKAAAARWAKKKQRSLTPPLPS